MSSAAAGEICLILVIALLHILRYIHEKEKLRGHGSVSESNTILKVNKGANQLYIKPKTEKKHKTSSRNQGKMCLQEESQEGGFFFCYRLFL